jgi:hypothetical protein
MGTTSSKPTNSPSIVINIKSPDNVQTTEQFLDPFPMPTVLERQVSVATTIPYFDEDLSPSSSVYTTKYHDIVKTMDLHKPLPNLVPGTPMDSTLIIDETGSMDSMGNEPVESIHGYIERQKKSGFNINITLVRFNEDIKYTLPLSVHDPNLQICDYRPNKMTALYDAVVFGILSATSAQNVVIMTDGKNNSSITTLYQMNTLIRRAESCGWNFTYIGCTREAYDEGTRFTMASAPIHTDGCDMEMEGAPPPPSLFRALSEVSDQVTAFNREITS